MGSAIWGTHPGTVADLGWPCSLITPPLLSSQDFGAEGSPRPLGQLLPKVQEVARCLGELLAVACASRVSVPWTTQGPGPAWGHPSPLS